MNNQSSADAERLRAEAQDQEDELTREGFAEPHGAPTFVGTTTTITTYPTAAQAFYALTVQRSVTGAETEGGPGTLTSAGATVLALNVGGTVPPPGTNVIATFVPYRWVFRYG